MAHITKWGILYQTNKFRGFLKDLGPEEKSHPVFEGRDIDNMSSGSVIQFYCPLGCSEMLLLPENTLGSLDKVLDVHFKECRSKTKLETEVENAESLAPVVSSEIREDETNKYRALTTFLEELMNAYSRFSGAVPIDAIRRGMAEIEVMKQMVVELHNPQTDFSYLTKEPKGFA